MLAFINKNNILYRHQYSFRKSHTLMILLMPFSQQMYYHLLMTRHYTCHTVISNPSILMLTLTGTIYINGCMLIFCVEIVIKISTGSDQSI